MELRKTRVLVVDDSVLIRQIVKESLESRGYDVIWAESGEAALTQIQTQQFDLFVLDIILPGIDGYQLCRRIRQDPRTRAVPVLMLTSKATVQEKVAGFEAGADDYMVKPFDSAELGARVRALLDRSVRVDEPPAVQTPRQLIVCFSLKGGAGTTTTAVNVAVCISQLWQKQVAVADFSLEKACVPLFVDLVPRLTMNQLIELGTDISSFDAAAVNEHLLHHKSGIKVLAAPPEPESAEKITAPLVGTMVEALRRHFPFVLCDTSSDFRENNLVLLERATQVLLLCTGDVAGVKVTSTVLRVFEAVGISRDKVRLVLSEVGPRSEVGAAEVESTLNQPVFAVIPYGGEKAVAALNAGVPIVLHDAESALARAYQNLAYLLTEQSGSVTPPTTSSSLLTRVRRRLSRESPSAP